MTYTPETLRKMADMEEPLDDVEWFDATLAGCAATWKKDRKRLEEAEKELDCVSDALDEAGAPQGTDEEIEGMMSERYYSLAERIAALAAGESGT